MYRLRILFVFQILMFISGCNSKYSEEIRRPQSTSNSEVQAGQINVNKSCQVKLKCHHKGYSPVFFQIIHDCKVNTSNVCAAAFHEKDLNILMISCPTHNLTSEYSPISGGAGEYSTQRYSFNPQNNKDDTCEIIDVGFLSF